MQGHCTVYRRYHIEAFIKGQERQQASEFKCILTVGQAVEAERLSRHMGTGRHGLGVGEIWSGNMKILGRIQKLSGITINSMSSRH